MHLELRRSRYIVEIEVLTPGGNQDAVKMGSGKNVLRMFRQFWGALVPKSPLFIYAKQILPVLTTLLPEMTQADLEYLTA